MKLKSTVAMVWVAAALGATVCAPASAAEGFKGLVGMGITTGGETLLTVRFTDGSTEKVKSGGLVHVFGGAEYEGASFVVQGNVGYHVDDSNAKNGSVRFSRYPVELLGFWKITDNWRIGGGIRKANNAKTTGSGDLGNQIPSVKFGSKAGPVLQAEYATGSFSFYGRFVAEKYTFAGQEVSGNHGGIGFTFRFF